MQALALIVYLVSLLSGAVALFLGASGSKAFETVGVPAAWVAGLGIGATAFLYNT
jgi:hypothetical protein